MSVHTNKTPVFELQQRISVLMWITTILLSLRGLFEFHGMKTKGNVELFISNITDPIVSLFSVNQSGTFIIPALDTFYAVLVVLVSGFSLQLFLHYIERTFADVQVLLARNMLAYKKARR